MNVSEPHQNDNGIWAISVHPGRADILLAALDPMWPFVLIETWDGESDWHKAAVSVGPGDAPRLRVVRHHQFDLLVTPADAVEIGAHLHARGVRGGGLGCFQYRRRPPATFRFPETSRGRTDAMRGHAVEMAIQLPHDGEVAVVASPNESSLVEYVARLA